MQLLDPICILLPPWPCGFFYASCFQVSANPTQCPGGTCGGGRGTEALFLFLLATILRLSIFRFEICHSPIYAFFLSGSPKSSCLLYISVHSCISLGDRPDKLQLSSLRSAGTAIQPLPGTLLPNLGMQYTSTCHIAVKEQACAVLVTTYKSNYLSCALK